MPLDDDEGDDEEEDCDLTQAETREWFMTEFECEDTQVEAVANIYFAGRKGSGKGKKGGKGFGKGKKKGGKGKKGGKFVKKDFGKKQPQQGEFPGYCSRCWVWGHKRVNCPKNSSW
jgi:hypothetical protein